MTQRFFHLLAAPLVLALLGSGCDWRNSSATDHAISGTIEADEVHIASRYGGRVERILAREGDALTAGATLIELDAAELKARRDYSAALLEEMVNGPRREEIAAARQEWEALTADVEFARSEDRRARELFAVRAVSATERDRASSRLAMLDKQAAAARSRFDLLTAGTRPERLAQVRAQLAEIDAQLRETRILAPTNCILEVLNVKVGDVLAPNREAATLLLNDHLWVRVFVPEPWLRHLQVGQRAVVKPDASPNETFPGVIEQISRAAEFTPRNVQTRDERLQQVFGVKIGLPNPGGKLRGGMSIEADFPNLPAELARPGRKPAPPVAAAPGTGRKN